MNLLNAWNDLLSFKPQNVEHGMSNSDVMIESDRDTHADL